MNYDVWRMDETREKNNHSDKRSLGHTPNGHLNSHSKETLYVGRGTIVKPGTSNLPVCFVLFVVAWFGHININVAVDIETGHTSRLQKMKKQTKHKFQLLIFSMWNDDKIIARTNREATIFGLVFSSETSNGVCFCGVFAYFVFARSTNMPTMDITHDGN